MILDFQIALLAVLLHQVSPLRSYLENAELEHDGKAQYADLLHDEPESTIDREERREPRETDALLDWPAMTVPTTTTLTTTTLAAVGEARRLLPAAYSSINRAYHPVVDDEVLVPARASRITLLSLSSLLVLALAIQPAVLGPVTRTSSAYPLSTYTPVSLACVLPPRLPVSSKITPLESYLAEIRRLAPQARILLLPEAALDVSTQTDLDAVEHVAKSLRIFVGVSVLGPREEAWDGKKAIQVVWVGESGSLGEYRKVNTVPCKLFFYSSSRGRYEGWSRDKMWASCVIAPC